jgi:hypothetical protein
MAAKAKSVPQGLKPKCKQNPYGTTEVVPLTKLSFSASKAFVRSDICRG